VARLRYLSLVPNDHTERTSSAARKPDGAALHPLLYLVMECARPLAGGMRLSLGRVEEVILGRADVRTVKRTEEGGRSVLRIGIPDKRMSLDHARLTLGEGGVVLEDLGSTNGTRVDALRIERMRLRSGKLFELGQTLFHYTEVEERVGWRASDLDCEKAPPAPAGLLTLDPLHAAKLDRLQRVAASAVPVMLLGETGTGKEVLARAVHALSQRPGPFVAVNCGAIPATLVESQLFGHVKGAFSGAVRDEPGVIRSAQYGTLFLDEIGDLPAASQAALLRVLQEGEVMPVGATRAVKVDLRVVCATHQPLEALMERGAFRRDLYARLAGFSYTLPPLRDRRADIGLLIAALLRSPKVRGGESLRFHVDPARTLLRYDWPLNVRELEQCLVTSSVLADAGVVRTEDLPAAVLDAGGPPSSISEPGASVAQDEAIRRELLMRLAECRGNVSEVARAMGKARQQVQRWVKRFGIDPDAFRARE
jgi:transcriptional regulator with PAS, ATPase and Fis domain